MFYRFDNTSIFAHQYLDNFALMVNDRFSNTVSTSDDLGFRVAKEFESSLFLSNQNEQK